MPDPAIEAVKNAAGENHWWITRLDDRTIANVCEYAEAAAREMAKSVQELHRKVGGMDFVVCATCGDFWPCETAIRVYPSEELGL
ncbi:hypothetical protein [Mycobacteroides abscessus]